MKTLQRLFPVLICMFFFLQACQPDEEEPGTPADSREKYVGSWKVDEISKQTGANPGFIVHINLSSTSTTQVVIENFYNLGFQYMANTEVSGSSMTIPLQVISGASVKGSGTFDGPTKLTMNYIVDTDTITSAVFTKQ
jgi:hypothetical protein